MRHGPDTTASVSVFLTSEEIGRAFANRPDDEQCDILRAIVRGFDKDFGAGMQASAIGGRLLEQSRDPGTREAVEFLRTILDSMASRARDLADMATPKVHE